MNKPLADLLRPTTLNDIVGQAHLIGENKPLSELVKQNKPQSMILWGPAGTGKTTIANALIKEWDCDAIYLSAIFDGVKEIKAALDSAKNNQQGMFNDKATVIFVDEIHRFNKAQQDAFLHHLEDGSIILIGATTENPSFEINNAILSRLNIYILEQLNHNDLLQIIDKASSYLSINLTDNIKNCLIDLVSGDARKLLNLIEHINNTLPNQEITLDKLKLVLPTILKQFDKNGENFYNQISALHKSIRGSDADAALYWFARMIEAGADPLYLGRRLIRIAWEDIGLADINAATVANNALQTYERIGSPEGELALANTVIYLAITSKSNSSYIAYNQVREFIKSKPDYQVPIHLRNAPTKFMADIGYGKEYKYAHDYPHHYVANEQYFPDELNNNKPQFYKPSEEGLEKRIIDRLNFLKSL